MICPPRVVPSPQGAGEEAARLSRPAHSLHGSVTEPWTRRDGQGSEDQDFPVGSFAPCLVVCGSGVGALEGGWVKIRAGLGGGRMWLLYSSRAIFRLHVSRPGGWRGWLICLPTSHPIPESCPPSSISNCLGPELLRRFHLLEGSFGLGLPSSRQ